VAREGGEGSAARRRLHVCGAAPPAPRQGRAVQVHPIDPTLKPPGTKPLKLKRDEVVSNFAFDFNLRPYGKVESLLMAASGVEGAMGLCERRMSTVVMRELLRASAEGGAGAGAGAGAEAGAEAGVGGGAAAGVGAAEENPGQAVDLGWLDTSRWILQLYAQAISTTLKH